VKSLMGASWKLTEAQLREWLRGLLDANSVVAPIEEDGVVPLTRDSVRGITHLGGTILGTTNRGNPLRWPLKREDGEVELILGLGGAREVRTYTSQDFTVDETLPSGVDLVWISAIAHQNSREQNRDLYAKAYQALRPGGRIMIRDIVMEDTRTAPAAGAMFAVNMLVNTEGGRTYSLRETTEELRHAGFGEPEVIRGPRDMDSVIRASRP